MKTKEICGKLENQRDGNNNTHNLLNLDSHLMKDQKHYLTIFF